MSRVRSTGVIALLVGAASGCGGQTTDVHGSGGSGNGGGGNALGIGGGSGAGQGGISGGGSSGAPAGGGGGASSSAKLSDIRVQTFNTSCAISASCHLGNGNAGGIDLGASRKSADLIADLKKPATTNQGQGPLAVPGNPDMSFLLHKLDGDLPCIKDFSCGTTMPQTGPKIPGVDIMVIHDWIAAGMQDD